MSGNAMSLLQNEINPALAGRLAMLVAALTGVAIVTLSIMYAGIPIFGPINDLTNAVMGIVIALLATTLHPAMRERLGGWSFLLLAAVWLGAAAVAGNSVLVAFGRMDWMLGGMWTSLGYGLFGVWLLGLMASGAAAAFAPGQATLGWIAAVGLLFGLLAIIPLTGGGKLATDPIAWIAYAGILAGWLLFPVWCFLTGRQLLAG